MEQNYTCRYCKKVCKNKNSLTQHERLCKFNPNRAFSPFHNINIQKQIGEKHRKKEGWICRFCNNVFETRSKLKEHYKHVHNYVGTQGGWNKGLTADTDSRIKAMKEKFKEKIKLGLYVVKGHPQTEESKKKISQGMKKAHAERRAGEWLGRNKKSYAEEFFTSVIENEFEDKNYEFNFHFGRYWLDFAWVEKKKCIEIDGAQHKRYAYQIENDIKKDELLKQNGWQILRIEWKEMFNNTKNTIQKAKDFIASESDD